MKFFDSIELRSLIIRIARQGIDESIYFTYLWYKCRPKISFICWWSDKEGTVFEEVSPDTIFAHSRVSDISISDIHRILWPESVADRESDFLIADHEPRMVPEIVIIGDEYSWENDKYDTRDPPWISRKEINHCSHWYRYERDEFDRCKYRDDPMLMSLIEDLFFEIELRRRHGKIKDKK
jgi:hypothetical protein